MVDQSRRKHDIDQPITTPLARSPVQQKYFFLDQKLYKMLRQERASDLLAAWDYEGDRVVHFILSDAKRRMKNAYDTKEVARLLNRARRTIQKYALDGKIKPPIHIPKGNNLNSYGKPWTAMKWSDEDILALHDYLLTHGPGRGRKDGILVPAARLPTRKELLAVLRNQTMFYMKTASGELVPVWSAYNDV